MGLRTQSLEENLNIDIFKSLEEKQPKYLETQLKLFPNVLFADSTNI